MKSVCVTLFLVLTVGVACFQIPYTVYVHSAGLDSALRVICSTGRCRHGLILPSHGAHLATVQSGSEKDFINGMIQNMPGGYWLDGVDDAAEGIWEWASTGQKISINLWYPGEPNQMTSLEDCMDTSAYYNGLWNDEECNKDNFCICEKPHV